MQEPCVSGERDRSGLRAPVPAPAPRGGTACPLPVLAAPAAVWTLAQLLLVVPGLGLGWDETVYVSQVAGHAPAAFFSAPRARGITFLVAPVAALTDSTAALRVYLAVLSGCGLFLALAVWRRLLPGRVLVAAGLLFAGLWVSLFYGPQAMPNLWVAFATLAAAGCLLRVTRGDGGGDRRALAGLGVAVAAVALMRPVDAVWLVLALAVAAFLLPGGRRLLVVAVLLAGAAAGGAEWVVEAVLRYGGLPARLHRASVIQGHLGWYFAVDDHLRALGGRTLCRPCTEPWRHRPTGLWFLALPLLVAGGLRRAWHTPDRAPLCVAVWVAAVTAGPYLFTVGYAAPRFLLPAYLLLALPTAYLLTGLPLRGRGRRAVGALLAVALAAHLAIQFRVLHSVTGRVRADTAALNRIAATLRAQGVRPPCLVSGDEAVRVAHRTGCSSRQPGGHDASTTPEQLAATARRMPVVLLRSGSAPPPAFARTWPVHPLPTLGARTHYRAHVSLPARPGPP
ncbi:hypothetical protein ACFWUZ_01855 [Streptomyces sp. NPDC058646]|uniref:hypothetical protein n=1 Tax=Streptomyces sp. NPDC058646 TaxID=3346574 RepID=UPI00364E3C12